MDKLVNYHEKYKKVARQAIAEGCVLIKNDRKILPIKKGTKVSLFGRSQLNYYKSGTGSGGEVNAAYVTGVKEALLESQKVELNQTVLHTYEEWVKNHPFDKGIGWAKEPWFQEEMFLTEDFVKTAAEESQMAIVLIGRTAGEDQDNRNEAGSYLLTEQEEDMLEKVCRHFSETVVLLNVGNIIDMKWVEKYNPSSVMYIWQGGQEGGNGVVDVLLGEVSPSGRLSDTIAYSVEDYESTSDFGDENANIYKEDIYVGYRYFSTFAPERVLYPFGYGLSYTTFSITSTVETAGPVCLHVTVKNTGTVAGKETVLAFCEAPQGVLGKPSRVLVGYGKTRCLVPGEEESLTISVQDSYYASYDETGKTGHKSCFVLEAGDYHFYVGENVSDAVRVGTRTLEKLQVLQQCQEAMEPKTGFEVLHPGERKPDGTFERSQRSVAVRTKSPEEHRREELPVEIPFTGDRGIKLRDVKENRHTMEEFVAQFSDEELCCLVRGEGMCSPKGTPGTASVFGGVTEELLYYGLPIACCSDGPSGIRMDCGTIAFSMPNGMCLACTFNDDLLEELYEYEGLELRKNLIDTLLGPGMNIHRNPLNGRNFEYFSEDPLLTGKLAAAELRGLHKYNVTGTIKHFACNNQEKNRYNVDAILSERALREIYLKGYEIAIKEGNAHSVMTTYGPVNGIWTAGHYDLVTKILRGDWNYTGIVMTDWWAKINEEGQEGNYTDFAAMVKAQNDLYMVTADAKKNKGVDNLDEQLEKGLLQRSEIQRCAMNICSFLMNTQAFCRAQYEKTPMDMALEQLAKEDAKNTGEIISLATKNGILKVPGEMLSTGKGDSTTFEIAIEERGWYKICLRAKVIEGISEVAQLPISVFEYKNLATTITLNGQDIEWKEYEFMLPYPVANTVLFLRFYFTMSGILVDHFTMEYVGPEEKS